MLNTANQLDIWPESVLHTMPLQHQPTPTSLTIKASPIKRENTDCAKHLAPVYSAFFLT